MKRAVVFRVETHIWDVNVADDMTVEALEEQIDDGVHEAAQNKACLEKCEYHIEFEPIEEPKI